MGFLKKTDGIVRKDRMGTIIVNYILADVIKNE